MNALPRVGIVGAGGAVGQAVVRLLEKTPSLRLRIGTRNSNSENQACRIGQSAGAEFLRFDIEDSARLSDFCSGCRVIVNCAGPSLQILDRVATAALAQGADYVDPGGAETLHKKLTRGGFAGGPHRALLTAGMMPGLSGLLPRWLARRGFDRPRRLTAYVGGRGYLTPGGAADYVLSLAAAQSDSLASWQRGARAPRSLSPLVGPRLDFFPSNVIAHPFLSPETERFARALNLDEVRWYNVFEDGHMLQVLGRLQGAAVGLADLSSAAQELMKAAALDQFGGSAYQLFVLQMEGEEAGAGARRTLMLRGTNAQDLTAAITVLAVKALLNGEISPGIHFAAEVLSPDVVDLLCRTPHVAAMQLIDNPVEVDSAPQEGML